MFGIVDDILVVGYDDDGRDHDETVGKVLQIHSEVNLKLNKNKISFQMYIHPILQKGDFEKWSAARPAKN